MAHTARLVAGEIDTIEILEGRNLNDVLEVIKGKAIERSILSGAAPGELHVRTVLLYVKADKMTLPETVQIADVANIPVQVR